MDASGSIQRDLSSARTIESHVAPKMMMFSCERDAGFEVFHFSLDEAYPGRATSSRLMMAWTFVARVWQQLNEDSDAILPVCASTPVILNRSIFT
jgi:hypothetical protein